MAYYFFPSCKATAQFKEASKAARAYVKEQMDIFLLVAADLTIKNYLLRILH